MQIHKLLETTSRDEGLRETALNDLQKVIDYYKHLVNKWTKTHATNMEYHKIRQDAGREQDAEFHRTIAARADVDRKKNQKTLDFLQTMYNLVAERSESGDEEAVEFHNNSLPPEPWLPTGPSVHLPRSLRTFLGVGPQ